MIRGRGVHGFLLLLTVNTRQPPWGREGPGVKKVKGTKRNVSKKKLGRKRQCSKTVRKGRWQYVCDREVLVTEEGRGSEGVVREEQAGVSSAGPTPGQASGDRVRHRSLPKEQRRPW